MKRDRSAAAHNHFAPSSPIDGGSSDITSGWQRRPCADYDTIPVTDTQTCDQTLLCGRHQLDLMLHQLSPRKDLMPRWWDLTQRLYYYLQRSNTDVRAQFRKEWKVPIVWIIVQGQRARRAKAAMDAHTAAEIHVARSWTLANTCTHKTKAQRIFKQSKDLSKYSCSTLEII